MGEYHLEVKSGSNPLPREGLTPKALTTFWFDLVSASAGLVEERNAISRAMDESGQSAEKFSALLRERYGRKIQIKTTESIAELLHEILAADAPYVCDETCTHLVFGATAQQVRSFADSLDAEIHRLKECLKNASHELEEGYRDELEICSHFREQLAELHGTIGPWRAPPRPPSIAPSSAKEPTVVKAAPLAKAPAAPSVKAVPGGAVQVEPEEINARLRQVLSIVEGVSVPPEFIEGKTQSPHALKQHFDANRLLEPFDLLKLRKGVVLDYVWRGGHHEGAPLMYARLATARPLSTVEEFSLCFGVNPTGYAPDFPAAYLPGLEIPDSILGAVQLASFLCEAPLFLMHWHAHYGRVGLCVSTNGRRHYLKNFCAEDQERVLSLPTGATVRRKDGAYEVEMLTFQDNQGFWLKRWRISAPNVLHGTTSERVVDAAVKRFY